MEKKYTYNHISMTGEEKNQLLEEIRYYFESERDEKIGILASENVLEFFMDILGKQIYNKALDDTKVWLDRQVENLEADFYSLYK
ncbi:MAG: DUF2164 domain-containing protein [Lachnospiraceae bacterium]|jgi:uncharacterized protein (DUF2164 family)|nr:DUF2164 domain-containing protein [Lachnospiraceae bacterium]